MKGAYRKFFQRDGELGGGVLVLLVISARRPIKRDRPNEG